MISETDIVAGYIWLLDRTPSSLEIANYLSFYQADKTDSLQDFRRRLLMSPEFRSRRLAADRFRSGDRSDLARERLAFVHIEKCGGTTLHEMLSSQFPQNEICPERSDLLGDWTINELAEFSLFSGHFNLACCRSIPGKLRVITMLREPKTRLVSLFSFWKAHRPDGGRDLFNLLPIARNSNAEEFFSHPKVRRHPSIRNAMAGQLTRTRGSHVLDAEDPVLVEPDRVLKEAIAALEGLTAFGLIERFEESRALLNHALKMQMEPTAPRQVLKRLVVERPELMPVPLVTVTSSLDSLLDQMTDIDRRLYAHALALFEQRVASLPPSSTPD